MNSTYQMCEVSLSLNFECHIGCAFIKYLPWYVVFKLSFLFSYTRSHHHSNNAMYDFFLAKYPISVVFWQRISPNLLQIQTWIYFAEQSRHQDWFLKIVEHHWNTLWRSSVSWSNTYIRKNTGLKVFKPWMHKLYWNSNFHSILFL